MAKASSKSASKSSKGSSSKGSSKSSGSKGSAKKSSSRKGTANPAFMAPLTPSNKLAEVVGEKPLPRTEVIKKIWDYIKKNDLQDKKNRRMINADEKLRPLFGKDQISMFDLAKIVNNNVSK
jgi:chromatin remodeling complex protein RSC6